MAKWQAKLTKKERKHFRYATGGQNTLKRFKVVLEHQMADGSSCWDCYMIAHKLGMEVGPA